tara:strand:- start:1720 stop:2100 length:381 start_codon:yes stop_codon:yes gene_type:complete
MNPIFFIILFLGLLSPMSSRANELNLYELSEYSSEENEVRNYSNVIPSDWAFKSLNKLAINRDCNFITRKSDSVSSRQNFTRHEAALIIKTCLKDARIISEEEKRLKDEFSLEINAIEKLFNENLN